MSGKLINACECMPNEILVTGHAQVWYSWIAIWAMTSKNCHIFVAQFVQSVVKPEPCLAGE